MPAAEMVEEDRGMERVGSGDVAFLRRGVDQAPPFVGGRFRGEGEDVVGAGDRAGQEDDAESGARPFLAGGEPLREKRFLVGGVGRKFQADAVDGERVDR